MAHQFPIRVYYEDTDMAGIVYHANYLKYIERARSDWVREMGVDQNAMKAEGLVFVVRRLEADYRMPARFDDVLSVETRLKALGGASLTLDQVVIRDGQILFEAVVTIVCITETGAPSRLPATIRRNLQ